jgi:hypothetical protein
MDEPSECSALLYAPLAEQATFRQSRIYRFDFQGDGASLKEFAHRTLVDDNVQQLSDSGVPALAGHDFLLDIGMKPGALDNEKEAIMEFYRSLPEPGFVLEDLRISRRYYVTGSRQVDTFVRDMCNPAIHSWCIG